MQLNDYQEKAMSTCLPTSDNFSYMILNLVGEVGEFSSKVAKGIRKNFLTIGNIEPNEIDFTGTGVSLDKHFKEEDEFYDELKKEAGDILWQLAGLCRVMDWTLEDVAQQNLDKLASRQQRNVIDGSGDNR